MTNLNNVKIGLTKNSPKHESNLFNKKIVIKFSVENMLFDR